MTVQVPVRIPRTVLPANEQYLVPRVMEIRMEPCERFGIFSETVAAIFAADALRFLRMRNVFTDVALLELLIAGCDVVGAIVLFGVVLVDCGTVVVTVEEGNVDGVVVGDVVDGVVDDGGVVDGDVVVAGNALKYGTARGSALSVCELSPNCP